ncbi:MAG: fibrobacter succinogenes major paralogous domain-containing protein [Chitinispirillales bacterium]|nr:fibrobacter succinogenes major paralogous domain-containing protein [Chitinispirillales bacterium]
MNIKKTAFRGGIVLSATVMVVCGGSGGGGNSKAESGSFTDPRDKQKYRTVNIGGQTWMSENLNYEPEISYDESNWCYDGDESKCKAYGRLYDWETAKAACPSGWRLPANDDWEKLIQAAGDKRFAGGKLKSINGWRLTTYDVWRNGFGGAVQKGRTDEVWRTLFNVFEAVGQKLNLGGNGTDEFGFSAMPGGYRYSDGGFLGVRSLGYWWSATESGASNAYYRGIYYDRGSVDERNYYRGYGFSVRCVAQD